MSSLTRPVVIVAGAIAYLPPSSRAQPAYAQKDKGPGFPPEAFISAGPVATGAVRRLLVNPQGEVDALLLADGTIVKFPPHMSQELVAAVRVGDAVSVRGFREPGGGVKAFVIVNQVTNQQVIEHPPAPDIVRMPPHLRFATLARLQVTGTIEQVLRGKNGEVNGALLSDGATVRFPPHAAFDFATILQPGQSITAQGLGTENVYGKGIEATAMGPGLNALRPIYGQ